MSEPRAREADDADEVDSIEASAGTTHSRRRLSRRSLVRDDAAPTSVRSMRQAEV